MRHPQGGLYHTRWPRPGHTPPTCVLGMVSVKVLEDRQLCCAVTVYLRIIYSSAVFNNQIPLVTAESMSMAFYFSLNGG